MDNERRRGLSAQKFHIGRIESLTDAIFAIAMTLLVLDLRVVPGPTQADLARQLQGLTPEIVSYVTSFFVAAFFWWGYHRMLQRVTHSDNGLVWWNIAFLFFVTLLPFTTHVEGAFTATRLAVEIYCSNLVALAGLLLVQWQHANARGLVDPEQLAGGRLLTARFFAMLLCYIITAIYGWFAPQTYFFGFYTIPIAMLIIRRFMASG